jgi:broad specificity phosphatase PhoE
VDFVFVRHGQSVANAEGWISGHIDTPLTDLGRQQARALVPAIAELAPDQAFCSDLQRAHQTALIALAGRLTPTVLPGLRERTLGSFEGRPRRTLRDQGLWAPLLSWREAPPGAESQAQLARRVLPVLSSLPSAERTLVVAHGGLIRVVLGLLDGQPLEQIGKLWIPNAEPILRRVPARRFEELLTHV